MKTRPLLTLLLMACVSTSLGVVDRADAQCEVQAIFEPNGLGNRLCMDPDVAVLRPWNSLLPEQQVVVYRRDGLTFSEEAVVVSPDGEEAIVFGLGMYVQGEWLAVGDRSLNRVHVFRYSEGQWPHMQTIDSPASFGQFGSAIAIHNDLMIIGSPAWGVDWAANIGTAHIYRLNDDIWELEQEIPNPDPYFWEPGMPFVHPDNYGSALTVRGDRAVIGAPSSKSNAGRTYVYEHDGEQWVHTQTFAPDPPDAFAFLGGYVGLADDFIMASAHAGVGRVYFFWDDGVATYIDGSDYPLVLPSPQYQTPQFGLPSALHPDGTHLLAGSADDAEAALGAGAAFLLRREGKEWPLQKKLIGSGLIGHESWGGTLAIAGDFAIVGAINSPDPGKVHIFAGVKGEDCNESGQPDACDIFFGESQDSNNNLIPDECEPSIPGDLNGDGVVNVFDLLDLLAAWGPCNDCTPGTFRGCPADLDGDCNVNVFDLLILLSNWG